MRTAKEIMKDYIGEYPMLLGRSSQNTYNDIIEALNEARKDCLVEAAKKCKGGSMMGEDEIAYRILSLIDEIK